MRSSMIKAASVALPLASLVSLTACRGVVVAAPAATTGAGTGTAAALQASTTASAAPAVSATPAAGSLTISMTSPESKTWTTGATVTCARTALLYLASADGTPEPGYNESLAVRVAPYRGPGTYRALVTLTVVGPLGGIASASGVPASSVTITATGGTFTIDRTGANGVTLDATATWTCP